MHFFDESFWIAVSFIIFLYLTYRPIKKAIISALDSRINIIRSKVIEAEKLKQDAESLLLEAEQEMKHLDEKKAQIIESAENSTSRLVESRVKEMKILLARSKESAINSIEHKKVVASQELRNEFTDNVIKLVRSYMAESKSNSTSDEEIINRFLNRK